MPTIVPEEYYDEQQRKVAAAQSDADEATLQYKALVRAISQLAPDQYQQIMASLPDYMSEITVEEQQRISGTKGMSM